MTWETPVPVQDTGALYNDTPWNAAGEYVGDNPGSLIVTDLGGFHGEYPTTDIKILRENLAPTWWDKLASKDASTNVFKVATGVGGAAQMVAGRRAAASQRQVGALNAAVLEGEAQFQLDKAALEEMSLRKKSLVLQGKQKAAYGASGIKSTEGSPLMVLEDTYQAMHDDVALIRWGGDVAATKLRNQIPGATMEAELAAKKSLALGTESLLTAGGRYWQLNG
ncbi:MAG: hypothetical protein RDU24_13715 [Humidesulfovibrio sp.]|uniref:hypothetical protein n=1 Tax=Humidesulfovibrio sp. TaxID=2910988 RepID=UPI0027E78626|nr:hypothetical protein [Humidesulfovibrio sp.]MDQ7836433.1 hypothetical protein [Humidesulfovibrio sp.]